MSFNGMREVSKFDLLPLIGLRTIRSILSSQNLNTPSTVESWKKMETIEVRPID